MRVSCRRSALVGLIAVGFITACASRDPVEVLYSGEVAQPFSNLLVIGDYTSADARRDFEAAFVRALREAGVGARYSLEFIRSTEALDRETVVRIAADAGADGVLISRGISLEGDADIEEVRETAEAERRNDIPFADFFRYTYVQYRDPAEIELTATVVLETNLFRVADEARVWHVQSSAVNKSSLFEIVTDEARALTRALARDGLIP